MSYSDPKLINDRTVQIVGGMTEMAKQQFAADRQAEQQRVTANISSLVQGGINALTPKAQAMNKLDKSVIKSSQNMYNKIGSSDFDTGLDKWDESLDTFMNGIVDQNNLTIQAMNNGSMIDLSKGQRDIAMYENIVDIYEEAVPNIKAASNVINRSANATEISQKLSLTGPPPYQLDIIRKMNTDEAGDLQIIQEGNNIIIRDPNATYIDPKTGKEVKGTELNINEFNKAITDKENPYFKYAIDTKPDTERNFNQKIKTGKDGAFNPLYVTIDEEAKDSTGQTVTTYNMTQKQQDKFKKDVMGDKGNGYANGGQFAGLIEEFGESIWEDQMEGGDENTQYPEEVPKMPTGSRQAIVDSGDKEALKLYDEQLKEYDTYYNDYYKPMLDALANQSLNNAASNGIVLDKPKEEPKEEIEEVTETEEVAEAETPEATEDEVVEESIVYGTKGFNTKPTEEQAENLKKAAKEPKTEDGFIKANQIFEENAGRTDGGKLKATPQTEEDLKRYFYTEEEIPNTKYSDGSQKYGTKKLFPTGEPNTAVYDMAAMINMNSAWDPRIIAAIAGGEIEVDERGDYLFGRNDKELKMSIDLSNIDPQKMLNEMTDLYKNTYANSENSSEMKKKKQLPEQYASYIERVKFIADRYGLELPKGYNEFGRPEEVAEEDDITAVYDND